MLTTNSVVTLKSEDLSYFGDSNYKDYEIEVMEAGDYYAGVWMNSSKGGDGKYTKYTVYVNGRKITDLEANREGWQTQRLNEGSSIPLKAGSNTITISSKSPEIPEIGSLKLSGKSTEVLFEEEQYDQINNEYKVAK